MDKQGMSRGQNLGQGLGGQVTTSNNKVGQSMTSRAKYGQASYKQWPEIRVQTVLARVGILN